MKKSRQETLMALGIIFIFALSSIAFVFSSFGGQQQDNANIKPLDKYVIDGEIDPHVEAAYIQGGFTFLKLHYNSTTNSDIISFVEQAPPTFTTPSGQVQIISQKISSTTSYITIVNINGEQNIFNVTTDKILETLCITLVVQPTECVINSLNVSS